MRRSNLACALAVLLPCVAAQDEDPCIQDGRAIVHDETCQQPIHDVVRVRHGALYAAKIGCHDCPHVEFPRQGAETERTLAHGDSDLFFTVALSHDNRSVLVNGQPVFPSLQTIPHPPALWVPQLPPAFSYINLSRAWTCPDPSCHSVPPECSEWCHASKLGTVSLDYLYTAQATQPPAEYTGPHTHHWTFALDALGGHTGYRDDPTWTFDDPSQRMLSVAVAGTQISQEHSSRDKDMQASGSLFGSFSASEIVYDLTIVDVQLGGRLYDFSPKAPVTLWATIRRFVGNDIWEMKHHRLLYMADEWGPYGKEGTLRNMLGHFVHWHSWPLVWIVLASIIGGLLALIASYRFFFWIVEQRELMKWDGMDDVWDKLRNHRGEEENFLLHNPYRDDPFEDGSSMPPRYTDDIGTMKPLPTKPLPEKPLPEVPLIDA